MKQRKRRRGRPPGGPGKMLGKVDHWVKLGLCLGGVAELDAGVPKAVMLITRWPMLRELLLAGPGLVGSRLKRRECAIRLVVEMFDQAFVHGDLKRLTKALQTVEQLDMSGPVLTLHHAILVEALRAGLLAFEDGAVEPRLITEPAITKSELRARVARRMRRPIDERQFRRAVRELGLTFKE